MATRMLLQTRTSIVVPGIAPHLRSASARPWPISPCRQGQAPFRVPPLPNGARDVSARHHDAGTALSLPHDYGYVALTVFATAAVVQWMMMCVARERVAVGLQFPKMYCDGDSEAENKFNCTQRGHQNTLETAPMLMAMVAVVGLMHPITASVLGMVYNLGRVVYFLGYRSGEPGKRTPGSLVGFFAYLGTMVTLVVAGCRVLGVLPV
eukprot:evm.model.scf_46EXC.4 EVM.evm.TU.scf_46EXC.4   scf_46EXC:140095-140718(-)